MKAYHDGAVLVVVPGDVGHALGQLAGELVGDDVICSRQQHKQSKHNTPRAHCCELSLLAYTGIPDAKQRARNNKFDTPFYQ